MSGTGVDYVVVVGDVGCLFGFEEDDDERTHFQQHRCHHSCCPGREEDEVWEGCYLHYYSPASGCCCSAHSRAEMMQGWKHHPFAGKAFFAARLYNLQLELLMDFLVFKHVQLSLYILMNAIITNNLCTYLNKLHQL